MEYYTKTTLQRVQQNGRPVLWLFFSFQFGDWIRYVQLLENPHICYLTYGTRAIMTGKAKWKPLKLSQPWLKQSQYCISKGISEISSTFRDLKKKKKSVVLLLIFPLMFWYLRKPDEMWWMTVNYHKLNRWELQVQMLFPDVHLYWSKTKQPKALSLQLLS